MVRVMHLMHLLHLMHLMHLVHLVRGVGINTQMHKNMFFSSRRCPVAKRSYRMFHCSRQFDQCSPPPNVTVRTVLRLAIIKGPLVDGCVLTTAARANNGEQLALADGFGRVRLLRYPAVNDDQVG